MNSTAETHNQGEHSGDLSRRAAHRREELRLSVDEVAGRAGMAPEYVSYLEHNPPNLSQSGLMRLARALDTTVSALLGTEENTPPGHQSSHMKAPKVVTLDSEQCMDLLRPGGVGRISFTVPHEGAPEVLPVNYAVVNDEVVFRTAADGFIVTGIPTRVSFQVDRLHGVFSQGWSVLIKGQARIVRDPAESDDLASANIRPWVGAGRTAYVALTPVTVTGRRIVSEAAQ